MNQNHKNIAAAAVAAAKYENSLQRKMNSGNNQGIRKTFKNHFAQQKHETGDKLNEKNTWKILKETKKLNFSFNI